MQPNSRYFVRTAEPRDVAPMVDLYEQVAIEGGHILGEAPVDRARLADRWAAAMARADGAVLVSESGGVVTGFAIVGDLPVAEVSMLVGGRWRGRGVGRGLLEAAIGWARGRGATKMVLEVFTHNTPAITLYRRCGFREVASPLRSYPRRTGEIYSAVSMELSLDR